MPDACAEVKCPYCNAGDVRQLDLAPDGTIARKRLKCPFCKGRFIVEPSKDGSGIVCRP